MDKKQNTALDRIKNKLIRIGVLNFTGGVLCGVIGWLVWTKVIVLPGPLPEPLRHFTAAYFAFAALVGILYQPIQTAFYMGRVNQARELLKKGKQKDWTMKDMPFLGCSLVSLKKRAVDGKVVEGSSRLLLCVPANAPMFGSMPGRPTNDRETEVLLNNKQEPILLIEDNDASLVLMKCDSYRFMLGPEWRA